MGQGEGKMYFDTLPLTDTFYVAYCEPEFDLGHTYQETRMPEKGAGDDAICRAVQWLSLIGAIFDLCHLLLRK